MVSGDSNRAPAFEMSPMPEMTWSASTTSWSAPSIRCIRGARSRNAASMRIVHRSGGSNTCESDERISMGTIDCPFSSQRGQHLAREDLQAARLQLRRNAAARIQLGHDAVQAELVAQPGQPLDDTGGGAEHDLPREDVVVGEVRHALGLHLAAVGGSGARPADGGPG